MIKRKFYIIKMKSFFDTQQMFSANQLMNTFIKEQYAEIQQQKVNPNVKPGFLRRKLPESPPMTGKCIEGLLQDTKAHIMPGIMNWQSPKYFGYFPGSINITTPMAQMFTSRFHSPGFNFAVAPAYTELENIMMDWCVQALGLPDEFLLKNQGGGMIGNNVTESVMLSINAAKSYRSRQFRRVFYRRFFFRRVQLPTGTLTRPNAAKYRAMKRLELNGDNPKILKFVAYFSEQCHPGSERALRLKDIYHRRVVPCVYNLQIQNYELDLQAFAMILKEDVQKGLIPLWLGLTYGSTFSAAIELSEEVVQLCKSYNMWINIDAAYLGPIWISEKYRPKKELLERVDSIAINFLKLLMLSPGGSVFFVADKTEYVQAMGGKSDFSFYKNQYSDNYDVIDYKDWSIGLVRRNYALHFFYLFSHFGLDNTRDAIELLQQRVEYFEELLLSRSDLFEIRFKAYSLISFKVKTNGKDANSMTKRLGEAVSNTDQGFCTPSDFKGEEVIRVVIGNFHTTNKHVLTYFNKIVAEAEAIFLSTQEEI